MDFLRGDWAVQREIRDWRADQAGEFCGTARFRPTADGRVLDYAEDGELHFGSHRGPARRRLLYCGRSDGGVDVRFADGREFYRLDLRPGTWEADHPCRADRYHATFSRLSADAFTETWQVAGPDKDYELRTVYRRAGGVCSRDSVLAGETPLAPAADGGAVAERSAGAVGSQPFPSETA